MRFIRGGAFPKGPRDSFGGCLWHGKRWVLLGIMELIALAAASQNRYYDYRERNPEGKVHILYTSGGGWHDNLGTAAVLRRFLEVRHEYYITYTEDYSVFAGNLDKYDVILLSGMPVSLEDEELDGLKKAVKQGKPVLGFHPATAALQGHPRLSEYTELIGANFKDHPPIHTFPVNILKKDHPVTYNLGDFDIYDEMYFYDDALEKGSDVLIEAQHKEKKTPIAWVRNYGKGKVFYTSLGHGPGAATNRHFQQLLLNALVWLTDEK